MIHFLNLAPVGGTFLKLAGIPENCSQVAVWLGVPAAGPSGWSCSSPSEAVLSKVEALTVGAVMGLTFRQWCRITRRGRSAILGCGEAISAGLAWWSLPAQKQEAIRLLRHGSLRRASGCHWQDCVLQLTPAGSSGGVLESATTVYPGTACEAGIFIPESAEATLRCAPMEHLDHSR